MDKRKIKSREKIKESFISLHSREGYEAMTVSALCKEAGISRGTFYAHYQNVMDVLDEVLDDALKETGRFWARYLNIFEEDTEANSKVPFCVFIRENKKYQKIFIDDAFSSFVVRKVAFLNFDKYYEEVKKVSEITKQQFKAILSFQTSGCLSITKMSIKDKVDDWSCIRGCIDTFVKSGLASMIPLKEDEV